MRLKLGGALAEAVALGKAHRDALIRIGGVFFFLPAFASALFLAVPDPGDRTIEQAAALAQDWMWQNAAWLLASALVQTLGTGAVLVLLLDPGRRTLAHVLGEALLALPGLVLLLVLVGALMGLGLSLLIVPGLYVFGRTWLVNCAYVDNRGDGPVKALIAGVRRTHGSGWVLFGLSLAMFCASLIAASVFDALAEGLTAAGLGPQVVHATRAAGNAAITSIWAVTALLVQVAAYRLLAEPRQGI